MADAPASAGSPLVVASYNVHGFVGRDGRHDPARVAAVIQELGADVVALQEVDNCDVSGSEERFESLVVLQGMEVVRGPTLARGDGDYGNLLLTRLPIESVRHHDLSVPGREPRGAIDAHLAHPAGRIRVIATHLGLSRGERRGQVRRLAALLEDDALLCVLAGDLNEWRRVGTLRPLGRHLVPARRIRTYPSRRPIFALDRIWVRPGDVLADLRAHTGPVAQVASDHLPLRATLVLARDDATPAGCP